MLETLRRGDSGLKVLQAQYLFSYVHEDGQFDEGFEKFISAFQTAHNLTADGVLGPNTYRARCAELPLVKSGSRGASVKALQSVLGIPVDGIFGPKTKSNLIAYQTAAKLTVDALCGKNTWASLVLGEEAEQHKVNPKPHDFKQYDSRWGKKMYSNHGDKSQTMSSSACGPTSMADIVATWYDKDATPYTLAQLALGWGNRTYNSGTSSTFFKNCHKKYAPEATYLHAQTSMAALIKCLDNGGYAVVNFGKSKWTSGGHYCCIYGYDGTSFYICDPASASATRAKGTYNEVKNARKGFYLFYAK